MGVKVAATGHIDEVAVRRHCHAIGAGIDLYCGYQSTVGGVDDRELSIVPALIDHIDAGAVRFHRDAVNGAIGANVPRGYHGIVGGVDDREIGAGDHIQTGAVRIHCHVTGSGSVAEVHCGHHSVAGGVDH